MGCNLEMQDEPMRRNDRASAAERAVSRRQALALGCALLGGAAGLRAWPGWVQAGAWWNARYEHHDHALHEYDGYGLDSQHQAVIDAALSCATKAEACVPHCVDLIANGDRSLDACLSGVPVLVAMFASVSCAASLDQARFKEVVGLCAGLSAACEKACRAHAAQHDVVRAFADACAQFVKQSRKLTRA